MKRIRTEPHGYGAKGDERIRTAVQVLRALCAYGVPSTDAVYEHRGKA